MSIRSVFLSLISLLVFQHNLQSAPVDTGNPVADAALYWTAGHVVNFAGHYWGKYTATEVLHLKGDITVSTRLTFKYLFNVVGREFFGNYLKTFPEALRVDIPKEARTDALTKPTANSQAWDAGRNFYTAWEFMWMCKDGWNIWNSMRTQKRNALTALVKTNTTEGLANTTTEMASMEKDIKIALSDPQILALASVYFYISNRISALSMHLGIAGVMALAKKTPGMMKVNGIDISWLQLDPFSKFIESCVITTMFSQFLRNYLIYNMGRLLEMSNIYVDEKQQAFLVQSAKLGDKALWAYYSMLGHIGAYHLLQASPVATQAPLVVANGHQKSE